MVASGRDGTLESGTHCLDEYAYQDLVLKAKATQSDANLTQPGPHKLNSDTIW